jgi:mono/diheme cytochrome c family protein
VLGTACDGGGASPKDDPAARGQKIYENVCIACHNGDPRQDGSLGPALAGASRALLEAKVLHGAYPPGYAPKRPGSTMPAFTYLAEAIGDLEAYLASVE